MSAISLSSFQTLTTLNLSLFRNILEVMKQFRLDLKVDFVREDLFVYPMLQGHFRMMIRTAWLIQLTRTTMNSKKIEYSSGSTTTTTCAKFCKNTPNHLPENHSLWMIQREKSTENKTFPRTREKESRWFLLNLRCVERMMMLRRIPSRVVTLHSSLWSNVSRRDNNDSFRFDKPFATFYECHR